MKEGAREAEEIRRLDPDLLRIINGDSDYRPTSVEDIEMQTDARHAMIVVRLQVGGIIMYFPVSHEDITHVEELDVLVLSIWGDASSCHHNAQTSPSQH